MPRKIRNITTKKSTPSARRAPSAKRGVNPSLETFDAYGRIRSLPNDPLKRNALLVGIERKKMAKMPETSGIKDRQLTWGEGFEILKKAGFKEITPGFWQHSDGRKVSFSPRILTGNTTKINNTAIRKKFLKNKK